MKIYTLLLTSVLLLFFSQKLIVACAGGDEEDIIDYSAFAPEIIEQPKYSPYFFTYSESYPSDPSYNPSTSDDYNLNEWFAFFDQKITKEDLGWLIYTCTSEQLKSIYTSISVNSKLPDTLQQKSLINLRNKNDISEIITYLTISKNAEPVFNPNNYDWYRPIKHDSINALSYQKEFLNGFNKSKNLFLKHRFGFQLMRAYFYSNDFQKAANTMDLMPTLNAKNGSIYYRCLGYKAASLYKLKLFEESNLIYAQLYDEYEPQKMSAYRSFHFLEDSVWLHNINLAKTTRHKENLWQLYGMYANPLKAMHHIYELNPNSELIPLLMVRNVNIIETVDLQFPKTIYANEENWGYYSYRRDPFINSSLLINNQNFDYSNKHAVLQFLNRVITERKVPAITPYLVSAAYLHALSKQFNEATKLSNEALQLSSNNLIINQAEIIKAFVLTMQLDKIDKDQELALEKQLSKILNPTSSASRALNAVNYVMYLLGKKYSEQNNVLKAELCYSASTNYYKESGAANDMIQFMEQPIHNAFEKLLISRYHLKLDEIYQIKATRLLYEYDYEGALSLFNKIKVEDTLLADPFSMRLVDCHDCDFMAHQDIKYTRKTFTKTMLDLTKSFNTEKNKETLAKNMFLYANALYNMTYFGNGRFIATTPISWMENNYPTDVDEDNRLYQHYYDCTEALQYYLKALNITKDLEFAAQCVWAAAKCEHNLKLTGYLPVLSMVPSDFEAGTYFLEMKDKYSKTKYYKEVLNECGYFCSYITKDTLCIRDKWSWRNR